MRKIFKTGDRVVQNVDGLYGRIVGTSGDGRRRCYLVAFDNGDDVEEFDADILTLEADWAAAGSSLGRTEPYLDRG